jgi:excisionase family DNA binding protein
MTLLTIHEAAQLLRLSKRTLYARKDIPRVRLGHRILFLKEDLEALILAHRQGAGLSVGPRNSMALVDAGSQTVYHRSPALRSKVVR